MILPFRKSFNFILYFDCSGMYNHFMHNYCNSRMYDSHWINVFVPVSAGRIHSRVSVNWRWVLIDWSQSSELIILTPFMVFFRNHGRYKTIAQSIDTCASKCRWPGHSTSEPIGNTNIDQLVYHGLVHDWFLLDLSNIRTKLW